MGQWLPGGVPTAPWASGSLSRALTTDSHETQGQNEATTQEPVAGGCHCPAPRVPNLVVHGAQTARSQGSAQPQAPRTPRPTSRHLRTGRPRVSGPVA